MNEASQEKLVKHLEGYNPSVTSHLEASYSMDPM